MSAVKYDVKGTLRREGFVLTQRLMLWSIIAGKTSQQELEATQPHFIHCQEAEITAACAQTALSFLCSLGAKP